MGNMMGQILPDGGALSIMTSSVQGMNSITIPWTVIRAKMERENQVNRAKFFAALIKYGPWAAGVAALAIGTSLAVQYSLEKIVGGI